MQKENKDDKPKLHSAAKEKLAADKQVKLETKQTIKK